MPSTIQNMYVLAIPDNNEYYMIYDFPSKEGTTNQIEIISQVPLSTNLACDPIPNDHCSRGYCRCFPDRVFSKGLKEIIVEDEFEPSENCFVLNIGAGIDIKYGKFVKRIHTEKLLYRGNWADPIKVRE